MRIASWNTKVGRGDEQIITSVRTLIRDLDPDVIALQECKGYTGALREEFGLNNDGDWQVLFHTDWPESNSNPVMVHKKYAANRRGSVAGWDTVRTRKVWTGPQGGDHKGRTWTWVKANGVFVMSLHRCTGMTDSNRDAGREEGEVLTRYLTKHTKDQVVIVGDHNVSPHRADLDWTSRSVAKQAKGAVQFDADDPGIDYAITKNLRPTETHVSRRKDYGSDHRAVLVVIDE